MTGGNRPTKNPMMSLLLLNNVMDIKNPRLSQYIASTASGHYYNTRQRHNQQLVTEMVDDPDQDQDQRQGQEDEALDTNPSLLDVEMSSSPLDIYSHENLDGDLREAWTMSYKSSKVKPNKSYKPPSKVRDLTMYKHKLVVCSVYSSFYFKLPSNRTSRICDVKLKKAKPKDPHYLVKVSQIQSCGVMVKGKTLNEELHLHFDLSDKRTILTNNINRQSSVHLIDENDPHHESIPRVLPSPSLIPLSGRKRKRR
jgi:hypothetical protein